MASAQESRADIGLLICGPGEDAEVESGSDALTCEPRKMLCVFKPSNNGPEEVRAGTFQTIGQGQELSHDQAMIWVVIASPATHGETNNAIVLQTLADAQALKGTDKQSGAGAIIVLVALKLLTSLA